MVNIMIKSMIIGVTIALVSTSLMASPTIMFTNPAIFSKPKEKQAKEKTETYDAGKIVYPVPKEDRKECSKSSVDCASVVEKNK